jgi:hypothetical protein
MNAYSEVIINDNAISDRWDLNTNCFDPLLKEGDTYLILSDALLDVNPNNTDWKNYDDAYFFEGEYYTILGTGIKEIRFRNGNQKIKYEIKDMVNYYDGGGHVVKKIWHKNPQPSIFRSVVKSVFGYGVKKNRSKKNRSKKNRSKKRRKTNKRK